MRSVVCCAIGLSSLLAYGLVLSARVEAAGPERQSECEIRANKFQAAHPHADPFEYLAKGFFFFGATSPPEPPPPYRDAKTGVTYRVGPDARQISATDSHGRVLWVRNPFVDTNMCPYRDAHPWITWIGAPGGGFGRHYLGPFEPTPDAEANARVFDTLTHHMPPEYRRAFGQPRKGDTFIGINFTSSQFGYVDTRNGDFFFMGQN